MKLALSMALAAFALAACPPAHHGAACTAAEVSCSGSCINVATDPRNCGACGAACAAGQSCSAGACACPSPAIACGGLCVTPSTDALNCGGCGKPCGTGELCEAGACVCQAGRELCSARCVDYQSDVGNCGGCGKPCAQGQVCSGGQCAAYCAGADGGTDGGAVNCVGSCVDLSTDPANCGGCGKACPTAQPVCAAASCGCPTGQALCGQSCVDTTQSQQNCGSCGAACASYESCKASACSGGPDFFAACFHSGALVGISASSGLLQTVAAHDIVAPAPDGGTAQVPANPQSLLFTDPRTLWLLDTINSQIDVLDLSVWPPTVKAALATDPQSYPNQLILCDGMVLNVNSGTDTVQGFNPTTLVQVSEVALGSPGENPYLMACDGAHTVYVTCSAGATVKAVDLSASPWKVSATLAVPDGGAAVMASPSGIAYLPADGGAGEVYVTLENLNSSYCPAGPPADVLAIDSTLASIDATIDPSAGCVNAGFLALAPGGALALEACGGAFGFCAPDGGNPTTGYVAPLDLATRTAGSLIALPIGSPTRMAFLKNGLVAITDSASGQIAVFNPADGGVSELLSPCPPLPDGGVNPLEFVGDVAAAP